MGFSRSEVTEHKRSIVPDCEAGSELRSGDEGPRILKKMKGRSDFNEEKVASEVTMALHSFRLGSNRTALHRKFLWPLRRSLPACPPTQPQHEDFLSDKGIRCLLVHDHVLLRQGLQRLLEDEP